MNRIWTAKDTYGSYQPYEPPAIHLEEDEEEEWELSEDCVIHDDQTAAIECALERLDA